MAKIRSWAGLDVHAAKVVAFCVDAESGEMTTRKLSGQTAKVVELAAALPGPVRVAQVGLLIAESRMLSRVVAHPAG